MRLKRIFDIVGSACAVCFVLNAQLCEISYWTVAFFLGTIVYGMTILYRAVNSLSEPSDSARLLGWFNQLHRHHDDG